MKIFVFVYKMATSHCLNQQHQCWSSSLTHICGTRDESINRNTVDRIYMSYLLCLRLPISNCWPEGMMQSDRTIHRGNPNHDLKVMIVWGVQDILPSGPSKISRWFSLCSVANEQRYIECLFQFNEHHRNDLTHTYLRSCYHPISTLLLSHKISQQILLHLTHWDRVTHIYQWWNIVNSNHRSKLQWNFNQNWYISIQETAFENVVRKLAAIFLWPQPIPTPTPSHLHLHIYIFVYICILVYFISSVR